MYKIPRDFATGDVSSVAVVRLSDGAVIPRDSYNLDYVDYLKWEEDGNTAPTDPPFPPTYNPITPRQLRLQLLSMGVTSAEVSAAIDAMPDATERDRARIEWEFAVVYERQDPLIAQIGTALGMSAEQINAAWLQAQDL